jgi:enoyl-CoA hydratase/carnithine racemase
MTADILFEVKNNLGIITLNRAQVLNALSFDMFVLLADHLKKWESNEKIKAVLIKSRCEKSFCAGGDLRSIYNHKHNPAITQQYFKQEYAVNALLYHFKKPFIALTQGITMGGGVGISIHGSHCVCAEQLRFAMPETLIGFFPDIAATYYLSRLPYFIGTYLALTGQTIGASDVVRLQLMKHIVPYAQFHDLEKKLIETDFSGDDFAVVTDLIHLFSTAPTDSDDLPLQKIADNFCFAHVEDIVAALQRDNSEWAQATLLQLSQRSPTSLKIALHQLQRAIHSSFDQVIQTDLHLAYAMLNNPDFYEGVRAMIIDKDKNPQWTPDHVSDVSDAMVQGYFQL